MRLIETRRGCSHPNQDPKGWNATSLGPVTGMTYMADQIRHRQGTLSLNRILHVSLEVRMWQIHTVALRERGSKLKGNHCAIRCRVHVNRGPFISASEIPPLPVILPRSPSLLTG